MFENGIASGVKNPCVVTAIDIYTESGLGVLDQIMLMQVSSQIQMSVLSALFS